MSKRILSQIGKPAKPAIQIRDLLQQHILAMSSAEQREWAKIHFALDLWNLRTGRGKAR